MNSSFSTAHPGLQLAWDSTSTGALEDCPRKYYYSIVCGYTSRTENIHFTFGIIYHAALERYDHARAAGLDHEAAVLRATRYALEQTWDRELKRPWQSNDDNKNRYTLVRAVVWYLEEFRDDPLRTIILANGKPAVELSFRVELAHRSALAQVPFMYCGHLDRVATLNDVPFIVDKKTTKSTIGKDFFAKYSPNNQFMGYSFGAKVAFSAPVKGLIVDAVQSAITFSRFARGQVLYDESQLEEWHHDLGWHLAQAESYAKANYWPMNTLSCDKFGGCQFREICAKPPAARKQWLERAFVKRVWDPLQVRGDI